MRAACQRGTALLVVVAAIVAGCGGSSAPSRADYGKRAEKICSTLDDRFQAIQTKAPSTTAELVTFADDLQRALDDGVHQLKSVQRPDGADGAKDKRWLDAPQAPRGAAKPAL